ncbi:synaptic vesicular amine transporter-like [Arctopsyche grandis]|uniref:synaptic vesicular amine transporter-like n=1 Tax=Arctopsyche grandis TaxID=121162 RepID=UPI00406D79A3
MNMSYSVLLTWNSIRDTKYAIVIIIYLAFFLDNMLLTVVVPIIPDFLHTTSLKLIPKSAFHDNIENLWSVNTETPLHLDQTTFQYQSKNISKERTQSLDEQQLKIDNEEIERENGPVGVLLSSKALVQLFLNPLVGIWTTRVGYKVPIFFGTVNLLIASLLFAYGESYMAMLTARSVQGVCSSFIGVSGMCLAAETFRDEAARSRMMGILMGGGALGVLAGYPFGGFLYEFAGKSAPFLIIAAMAFLTLDGAKGSETSLEETLTIGHQSTVWWPLLNDNVIMIATGAIFISTSAMAILEPCLPIWLMTHLKPEKWQLGTVFIPDSLGYLIGTNFFGVIACRVGPWRVSVTALLIVGISAFVIPSATSLGELLLPHFGLGLGIGALDAALVPQLAALVDKRHAARYGAVFSLQQTAVSLAYSIAPLAGGALARAIGFSWTMRGLGILNALYSPLLAGLAWKLNSEIQSSRLIDSQSSDCENLNQAISMATYGTAFE